MKRLLGITLLAALFATCPGALAQFVWTGQGTDGFAGSPLNWTPSAPVGSGTENVAFGNFTGPQTTVLLPDFAVNNIDFTGTTRPALTFSGFGGPATLTLNGNVTMTSGNSVLLGSSVALVLSNASHVVDVAGAASLLTVAGNVSGSGSITKLGSGSVTATGTNTYSGGTTLRLGGLKIDGGSITHSLTDTFVGSAAGDNAFLNLVNGGDLTNRIGQIGAGTSTGSVTVSGAGSTWTNTNYLYVGAAGNATLLISNGGAVYSPNTSVGNNVGGSGTLAVQGTGSALTNSSALYVGSEGFGSLSITNGGQVTNVTGVIANNTGGSGFVSLNGPGSTWTNSGSLLVGGTGVGNLLIGAGATVSSAIGQIGFNAGSIGSVGLVDPSSLWINSTSLAVGISGAGSLGVNEGSKVDVAGGTGTITLGANSGASGSLMIGTASPGGFVNAATITTGVGSGAISFHTDATATSPYYFTRNGTSSGPAVSIAGATQVTNISGYTVLSGANTYTGGTVISGGTLVAAAPGSPLGAGNVSVASGATLALSGVSIGNPLLLNSGSRLIGNGSVANATIGAGVTLAPGLPGNPIGQLHFEELTLGGLGGFEFNVKYNGEGFDFDSVHVQNTTTLNILATAGSPFTLQLISLNASGAPGLLSGGVTAGTTYSLGLLTTNGISGDFTLGSNLLLDATGFLTGLPVVSFGLTRTGNNYTLNFTPVPEPSTWALFGLGLAGFGCAAWRRRR